METKELLFNAAVNAIVTLTGANVEDASQSLLDAVTKLIDDKRAKETMRLINKDDSGSEAAK